MTRMMTRMGRMTTCVGGMVTKTLWPARVTLLDLCVSSLCGGHANQERLSSQPELHFVICACHPCAVAMLIKKDSAASQSYTSSLKDKAP
jgi:hypothetical protein